MKPVNTGSPVAMVYRISSVLKMVWKNTATVVTQSSVRPVPNEDGGAEEEFAAADRGPEHDDAGADGARPAEPLRSRRNRQFRRYQGIDPGAGFQREGRVANQGFLRVE